MKDGQIVWQAQCQHCGWKDPEMSVDLEAVTARAAAHLQAHHVPRRADVGGPERPASAYGRAGGMSQTCSRCGQTTDLMGGHLTDAECAWYRRPLRYTLTPSREPWDDATCAHCGQVAAQHHGDARCYTVEEISQRLTFFQRHRRWPGPDEGCDAEEDHAHAR